MLRTFIHGKIHRIRVTECKLGYNGSAEIDTALLSAAGISPYEQIQVVNMNNGERLETYAIPEPFGSRRMVMNGAAARKGQVGDRIIIMSFCRLDEADVRDGKHKPRVLRLDENNEPVRALPHAPTTDEIASMLG